MKANFFRSHVILMVLALATHTAFAASRQQNEPPPRPSDIDFTVGDDSMVIDSGIAIGGRNSYLTAGAAYHRDDGQAAWLGWQMRGHARNAPSVFGGLGIAVAYIDADEEGSPDEGTGVAVPITALLGYSFVNEPKLRPLSFMLTFAAAPRTLAFSDISNFYSFGALMSWEVIENASIMAGYRNINTDIENLGAVRLSDSMHLGVSFRFY